MNHFQKCAYALIIFITLSTVLHAEVDGYEVIISEWRAANAQSISGKGGPQQLEAAAQKLRLWREQQGPGFNPRNEQQSASFELIDFALAKAWARAGDYNKASMYLKKEASAYQNSEGHFLELTRNPNGFAIDVFTLHSEIMANTGVTNTIPGSGYDVFPVTPEGKASTFTFVYGSDGEFQAEFETKGVEANEQKKMIYLFEPDSQGRYAVADRAQVIADRERFTVSARKVGVDNFLVVGGITKIIDYQPKSDYPDVKVSPLDRIELSIGAGKIEQPLAAIQRAVSTKHENIQREKKRETKSNEGSSKASSADVENDSTDGGKQPTSFFIVVCSTFFLLLAGVVWYLVRSRTKRA